MKARYLLFALIPILAVLAAGCVKEGKSYIKLYTDGFELSEEARKAAVDGRFTYWLNGEYVRINHRSHRVSLSGDSEAVASDVPSAPDYTYGSVYPSKIFVSSSNTNYTVRVPRQYYYKESEGRQVLDGLPMAAYYSGASDPTELHFCHLTAALTVRVKNEKSHALDIDRIELVNSHYQLGGDITFDISTFADSGQHAINPNKTGVPDTVSIHFAETSESIPSGQHLDVQIPILPVGADNSTFTINVYCHKEGSRYIYSRTTASRNNSISRACLGYAVAKYDSEQVAEDLFDTQVGTDDQGRQTNFFEVGSADDLRNLSSAMDSNWTTSDGQYSYQNANYVVTNDIDMQGATLTPIHYYNKNGNERCIFDGQGHTISNFTASSVNENEPNCCGLFGKTSGDSVTIRNLNVDNAVFDFAHVGQKIINHDGATRSSAVAGIYAVVEHAGIVIENCTVTNIHMGSTNDVVNGEKTSDFYASGLVGLVQTSVTIRNCYVGSVFINNLNDTEHHAVVDQFGAAIGRIDVGNAGGSNSYERAGENCPVIVVENFTYEQGNTPLVFGDGLKSIRYGGIVANITCCGKLVLDNCRAMHNVVVNMPENELYCGGLIGCNSVTRGWAIYLNSNCVVSGNIDNQAVTSYSNTSGSKSLIEKYIANGTSRITKVNKPGTSTPSSSTCSNTLTVSGKTLVFNTPHQSF